MPRFIAVLYGLFLVLIEISKRFVIQGFEVNLVNFLLNLISGALWSTKGLKILKTLLNSSFGFSWLLVKFTCKFLGKCN